jgi:SMC interacting uncharacterized protein involved in chromosome segregation
MENDNDQIRTSEYEIHPTWIVLNKHLDTLEPSRYPFFSARKKCVEAMEEFAQPFKDQVSILEKEVERLKSYNQELKDHLKDHGCAFMNLETNNEDASKD